METRPESWLSTPHWHGSLIDPPELRSTPVRTGAVYARVSSSENKDNLERQAERLISWCNAQGWGVSQVVKECGSGINDQRPKFLALEARSQDRTDCGGAQGSSLPLWSGYIQTLLAMQGRELGVVNTADTAEDDLMGDFVDELVRIIKKNKMQAVFREKIERS